MHTIRRRRRAGGRRGADERYAKLKAKIKNLIPSLLGDRFLLIILGNELFSKSEACKTRERGKGESKDGTRERE